MHNKVRLAKLYNKKKIHKGNNVTKTGLCGENLGTRNFIPSISTCSQTYSPTQAECWRLGKAARKSGQEPSKQPSPDPRPGKIPVRSNPPGWFMTSGNLHG